MSTVKHFYVGDFGVNIDITVYRDGSANDISTSTARLFVFRKPDGKVVSKTAALVGGGTTGQLRYTVEDGFFDQEGDYQIQVVLTFASSKWRTTIVNVSVEKRLGQ